jgi:pimeloyl-ACP methyl ester carboxylesterase
MAHPRRVGGSAALLAALALVVAGCGREGAGGGPAATAATTAPATTAPATTLPAIGEGCLAPAERAHTLRFRAEDGASVAAVVLGRGRAGVVLAHQVSASLCQMLPYARELAKQGYRALALDLEGYGASTQPPGEGHYDADVVAAVQALRDRGATRVALLGASLGGTTVVTAAARTRPPVDAVVCLSGPSSFSNMDAAAAAKDVTAPALFVGGRQDPGAVEAARTMYAAARAPGRELLVVPGPYHGVDLLDPAIGPDAAKVRAAVTRFLREHAPT